MGHIRPGVSPCFNLIRKKVYKESQQATSVGERAENYWGYNLDQWGDDEVLAVVP